MTTSIQGLGAIFGLETVRRAIAEPHIGHGGNDEFTDLVNGEVGAAYRFETVPARALA